MALPSLLKTWRFAVNQAIPAGASAIESAQYLMYAIHQALMGNDVTGAAFAWTDSAGAPAAAPAALWAIESSCDSVNFGNNDQVDHINAHTQVVSQGFGSPFSWAVYTHSVLGISFDWSFRYPNFDTAYAIIADPWKCSIAGYGAANGGADGAANARPTATDEQGINSTDGGAMTQPGGTINWIWNGRNGNIAHRLHTMMSSDGEITRIIATRAGSTYFILDIEKPRARVTVDPSGTPKDWNGSEVPWVGMVKGAGVDGAATRVTRFNNYVDNANDHFGTHMSHLADSSLDTGITLQMAGQRNMATDEALHRAAPGGASEFDGLRPFIPLNLQSRTIDYKGQCGKLTDIWMGNDTDQGLAEGDTYPNDLTRQFIAFGNFIFPWNGSVPLLT